MNDLIPAIGPQVPAARVEMDRGREPVKAEASEEGGVVSSLLTRTRNSTDIVSLDLNLSADAESLKLSLSVVMDRVAEQMMRVFADDPQLREILGLPKHVEEHSIEQPNDYFSPEKTAQRIIDFTTGFLSAYRLNHEEEEEAEQIRGFTALIQESITKGFDEAIRILGGPNELGKTGETIERIYHLVMEGLEEFRDEQLDLLGETEDPPIEVELPIEDLTPEVPSLMDEALPPDEEEGDVLDVTA